MLRLLGLLLLPALLLRPMPAWSGQPPQPSASPPMLEAVVEAVGDGDSLRVRVAERPLTVRLACIDAPELAQFPDGPASHRALQRRLPPGSRVRLIPRDSDRYGRLVAEVLAGVNVNLAQVAAGQAFVDQRHVAHCSPTDYTSAERRASRERAGIWRLPGGIERPWEFRSRHPRRRSRSQPPARPSGLGIGRSTITPTTSGTPAA